jgi:hypothetical protein
MTLDTREENLADVATAGLGDVGEFDEGGQDALIPEGDKVSFVGMRAEVEKGMYKIRDEVEMTVKGRVVFAGDEEMADGHIRAVVKVRVSSVVPNDAS